MKLKLSLIWMICTYLLLHTKTSFLDSKKSFEGLNFEN